MSKYEHTYWYSISIELIILIVIGFIFLFIVTLIAVGFGRSSQKRLKNARLKYTNLENEAKTKYFELAIKYNENINKYSNILFSYCLEAKTKNEMDTLDEIEKCLKQNIEYLNNYTFFTEEDKKFIKMFCKLTDKQKESMLSMMQALSEKQEDV